MNIKFLIAQKLALMATQPVNLNDILIESEYVKSDGTCVVNYYHDGAQMSITTFDWEETITTYGWQY